MAYRWPAGTVFKCIHLDVEDRACPVCELALHVCDHRYHHLWTLQGPTQVVNRLVRCPDPTCESRGQTFSPEAALYLSMQRWCMGWDVFCWLGHRRFARHWSVPPHVQGGVALIRLFCPVGGDSYHKRSRPRASQTVR